MGEISGHSKFINNIDYRPVRPFRVVTAGEDKHVNFYEGPPFRYKSSNSVRAANIVVVVVVGVVVVVAVHLFLSILLLLLPGPHQVCQCCEVLTRWRGLLFRRC